MKQAKPSKPTERELSILNVLWERGPATARQVHDEFFHLGIGYTTVQKMMQIMFEKGLLARDTSGQSHVYSVTQPQQAMQQDLARDLLDKAFGGSAVKLVVSALSAKPVSQDELEQIETLLERFKRS